MTDTKHVLSWGLGLQSTLLGVLSVIGELPKLDLIISADMGNERKKTYEIRDFYTDYFQKAGIEVIHLNTGNIVEDGASSHIHIPFWTESGAPLRRQCTSHFKIDPIKRYLRQWLGYPTSTPPHPPPNSVYQWLGFTIDERYRVNPDRTKWERRVYPLIDLNIARWDCKKYFTDLGLPVPIKSACIICPYRTAKEWLEMKEEEPDEFDNAVSFDEKNRGNPLADRGSTADRIYVWREAIPLKEAKLESIVNEKKDRPKVAQLGFPLGCDDGYCHI